MDSGWLAGLMGFAFAMAATPGPNNTLVTASGTVHGVVRTLPLMAGIAMGVGAIMLAVAALGSSLVMDSWAGAALRWVGVLYVLRLAWKIVSAEPKLNEPEAGKHGEAMPLSFGQGAIFQFVNPKLWVMVSGALVTYGQQAGGMGRTTLAILFALVFGLTTFISTVAWTALGACVGRLLASPRSVRAFNLAMAVLLVGSLAPVVLG